MTACLALFCAGVSLLQTVPPPSLPVVSAKTPVKLDGLLDDPAWTEAAASVELTQQSPRPGGATPYRTTVRVIIQDNKLYFGFECGDPDPSRIAVHTMRRDASMDGDDTVSIVLNTSGDNRTGYLFRVNAAGAIADGLIAGREDVALDWDGIWDARTARTDTGWSAEIMIPANTLSFVRGAGTWGVNFERSVPRDHTVLRWASPLLDVFFLDVNRAGSLVNVTGLDQGHGLELSPFVAGRSQTVYREGGNSLHGQPGADVTWRMTPQLAALFTVNTDFAEADVDSLQLNVTRFPLFYPEKRPFFLEGANQFGFAFALEGDFIPFFSRTIGLFQGDQAPIDAGSKLIGRAGRWTIGMLDVETRLPKANLLAARTSYDVTRKLRVGSIFTNGNPDGIHVNRLAGFDGSWQTSELFGGKNFQLVGWSALSRGDGPPGSGTGWGYIVDFPNDLVDCFHSLNQFGEGLNPGLGFLPRPGIRKLDAACRVKPRPAREGRLRFIRQAFVENQYQHVSNARGQTESWSFLSSPIGAQLDSGERFDVAVQPQFELLTAPFQIAPGVTLPAGAYRFNRYRGEFSTSDHRPWGLSSSTWFGTFYDGRLVQQTGEAHYTTRGGRWQTSVSIDENFGRLHEGNFIQRLVQVNVARSFRPNLILTSFFQYDTQAESVGNNLRLRWTIRPGNDLFVVWNRNWQRLVLSPHDVSIVPDKDALTVKLRWTFRK
jgi:hypothetical protein